PLPRTDSQRRGPRRANTWQQNARAFRRQDHRVASDEPTWQCLGPPGAPDQGAQRLLPVLWPAALLSEARWGTTAGPKDLVKDAETPKPARPPNHRLGQPACQT